MALPFLRSQQTL